MADSPTCINLNPLLADAPPLCEIPVEAARELAHAILDACELADPTDDEDGWVEVTHEEIDAQHEAWSNRIIERKAGVWQNEVTTKMGLEIHEPSPRHVQFKKGDKVLAEWWPSRGTTMHAQRRGPVCRDGAAVLRWLRSIV